MPIRVILADDHADFRHALRQILDSGSDITVVAEASSGSDAVHLARLHQPDVVLLDVRMKLLSGIDAIPHILLGSPGTAILMVSMHDDKQYVLRSIEVGARGYLLKESLEGVVIDAIHQVHAGHRCFSSKVRPYVKGMGSAGSAA